ncbi:hypothetical protein JB92DRAFT_2831221 [Gautieria morchelliformis]|nr:hypothetical protein JB92DRAFT_2831221 [Gautieria morchelliformis]
MKSAIFWTKNSAADITPTWEKVNQDEEALTQQMVEATMHSVIDNLAVQHGHKMSTGGIMVRGMGLQSVNGKLYTGQIKALPDPMSTNTRHVSMNGSSCVKKCIRTGDAQSGIVNQAVWYTLVLGFLPAWVKHQKVLCGESSFVWASHHLAL